MRDILAAIEKIEEFTASGFPDLSERSPVWDSILHNLTVTGEAVKALPAALLEQSGDVGWRAIARMRDLIVHRYFEEEHIVVRYTVEDDIPRLKAAVEALVERLERED
ncbi:MAG: DUF86 domain-containing protein [Actinomycetota bacterium]|nr:DUF86 domain-containing protein [Actinomycetota bacterium]